MFGLLGPVPEIDDVSGVPIGAAFYREAHGIDQISRSERLLDQRVVPGAPFRSPDLGKSGHIEHLQARPGLARPSDSLDTVQRGHGDVDDHQVAIFAALEDIERGLSAVRLGHSMSRLSQHVDHDLTHSGIVIDHEDVPARPAGP